MSVHEEGLADTARIAKACLGGEPMSIKPLGGGFYGSVYLVALSKFPDQVIVKIYKTEGLNEKEALQLETLGKHGTLKVPQILGLYQKSALLMAYIPGVNAGIQEGIPKSDRDRIGGEVIENLLAYHDVKYDGFGELNAAAYADTWKGYYRKILDTALSKACVLRELRQISDETIEVCDSAASKYDEIFVTEDKRASLIHGDYNMWNILLNEERTHAVAVIDPFNGSWSNAEYDLYQLNNANGKDFGLMEKYGKQRALSENFEIQRLYYELFCEIMHYHDACVDASKSSLAGIAQRFGRVFDLASIWERAFVKNIDLKKEENMNTLDFSDLPETGFSEDTERKVRAYFSEIASNVDAFAAAFRAVPNDMLYDETYMERFVCEKIGLNNESLGELAPELAPYFGTGLYIWQNPKQFSRYIIWLLKNARGCQTYLEIGCRWGGTFIVTCEILRRVNPNFQCAIAADLIEKTSFIERYVEITKDSGLEIVYFQGSSTSAEFIQLAEKRKPDISLVDGDHKIFGVLKDHMLVRRFSKIIVHHDVCSDTCPESTLLWNSLKQLEAEMSHVEFTEQYPSMKGNYFGIGALFKKDKTGI